MNVSMDECEERMSPDLMGPGSHQPSLSPTHEEPRDLSIKRKMRPVPPPLDLSKRNLDPESMIPEFAAINTISPRSPLTQKSLPLRKRAHSWSFQLDAQGLQLPPGSTQGVIRSTAEASEASQHPGPSASSSSSSLRIPGLPTPHTPHTPHPHSAIPVITSRFPFEPGQSGPLNLSTAGGLPSSLLSPAPSHPSTSSLNSSREELESDAFAEIYGGNATHGHAIHGQSSLGQPPGPHAQFGATGERSGPLASPCPSSRLADERMSVGMSERVERNERLDRPGPERLSEHMRCGPISPGPASISPQPSDHQWPTNVWSVFMSGVRVYFVLAGGQVTGARISEELGQLERTHQQQYAPHGLHVIRILHEGVHGAALGAALGTHNTGIQGSSSLLHGTSTFCQLYFRPVMVQQEDIMVVAPPDHPFYVHGKGWCSVHPDRTRDRYSLPCGQLIEGDVCLPPYHPETTQTPIPVVTPDLADAMKRFDFNDDPSDMPGGAYSAPPSATFPPHTQRTIFLSPPASPSKKGRGLGGMGGMGGIGVMGGMGMGGEGVMSVGGVGGNSNRPRRPMNGFMLFAKHHRLKLIQQYPGKDNRAISVLLGAMWKSLPEEDRERFNAEARAQAEERKRIDPDCWKRKRSHSTS